MLRNYLKAALRNILKNKIFSLINVVGLAIGMAGCLLITQYVLHELSYDQMQSKKDRIFRIQLDRYNKGEVTTRWEAGAVGIGPDLKAHFPEVRNYTRMHEFRGTLANGETYFKEDHIFFASEDFFKIFSFKLIRGVDSVVLREPHKVVLSTTMASFLSPGSPSACIRIGPLRLIRLIHCDMSKLTIGK